MRPPGESRNSGRFRTRRLMPGQTVASLSPRPTEPLKALRKGHRHQGHPGFYRAQAVPQSFGSLKTEEKTERQCGQRVVENLGSRLRRCLSILRSDTHPISHIYKVVGIADRLDRSVVVRQIPPVALRSHERRSGLLDRVLVGEFDPGSGRTLAACFIHASRTGSMQWQHCGRSSGERVSNT